MNCNLKLPSPRVCPKTKFGYSCFLWQPLFPELTFKIGRKKKNELGKSTNITE